MLKKIKNYFKQLFCKHDYVEKCSCGDEYYNMCSYRRDFGTCIGYNASYGFVYDCDYLYLECRKCGEKHKSSK